MSPFKFFKDNRQFPFNMTSHSPFHAEYFQNIRQMVKQYQSLLNDDFWENIATMGQRQERATLPIEIWENDEFIFLMVLAPGLTDLNDVEEHFINDQLFRLQLQLRPVKPESAHILLKSELPHGKYEREIFLPKAVETMDYSVSLEKGMLTYIFKKIHEAN